MYVQFEYIPTLTLTRCSSQFRVTMHYQTYKYKCIIPDCKTAKFLNCSIDRSTIIDSWNINQSFIVIHCEIAIKIPGIGIDKKKGILSSRQFNKNAEKFSEEKTTDFREIILKLCSKREIVEFYREIESHHVVSPSIKFNYSIHAYALQY